MPPTRPGLPAAWLDLAPGPAGPFVAPPFLTEINEINRTGEIAGRGEAAAPPAGRRRWSLRRRRRESELVDASAPDDLDLVGLAAGDEHVWSDLSLAALEEPDATDSDASMPGFEASDSVGETRDDPWSLLAEELQVRELQTEIRARAEREHAVLARRRELELHRQTAPTEPVGPIEDFTELATGETEPKRLELEDEFWAEGSTMSPGWLQRRKHREDQVTALADEPMEMLDLSAYDVPPERRGVFRDAVAAASDEAEREWAKTARELPS